MGIDYAFELIAERPAAERLVRAVCEHLAPEDRARLLGVLSLGVADIMKHVPRDTFERQDNQDTCLSFLFAPDEFLTEYAKESPRATLEGRIRVGCIWTSIQCGNRFTLLRATAATSDMSRLFEQSTSIQQTFSGIGQSGGALLLTFDDEKESLVSIWPIRGRFIPARKWDDLEVDDYCADMIASAPRAIAQDG